MGMGLPPASFKTIVTRNTPVSCAALPSTAAAGAESADVAIENAATTALINDSIGDACQGGRLPFYLAPSINLPGVFPPPWTTRAGIGRRA
jgi:hypothetical protein